jgi:hypothetical protein
MRLLVCGTRGKGFKPELIKERLNSRHSCDYSLNPSGSEMEWVIIEGCCPDSPDVIAEEWAREHNVEVKHYPANSGNYLKRNIEMVDDCTMVFAFWDGFSYGTAHTIATAVMKKKPVAIWKVTR